jgi:hypothetical protein
MKRKMSKTIICLCERILKLKMIIILIQVIIQLKKKNVIHKQMKKKSLSPEAKVNLRLYTEHMVLTSLTFG